MLIYTQTNDMRLAQCEERSEYDQMLSAGVQIDEHYGRLCFLSGTQKEVRKLSED